MQDGKMHKKRHIALYKTNKRRQSEKNVKKVLTNGAENAIISKPQERGEYPGRSSADSKKFLKKSLKNHLTSTSGCGIITRSP